MPVSVGSPLEITVDLDGRELKGRIGCSDDSPDILPESEDLGALLGQGWRDDLVVVAIPADPLLP